MDLGTLRASHAPIAERDLKGLAERADAAQLAIENATAGSIALGTTLGIVPGGVGGAGFPMVGFGPAPKDVIVSRTGATQFRTYSCDEQIKPWAVISQFPTSGSFRRPRTLPDR